MAVTVTRTTRGPANNGEWRTLLSLVVSHGMTSEDNDLDSDTALKMNSS
jgi:hypothetical protein